MNHIEVELTESGYVRLSADIAALFFPSHALVALLKGSELWLMPLVGPEGGGLFLKQRNACGDRSALVSEALPSSPPVGVRAAVWDERLGALRVDVSRTA